MLRLPNAAASVASETQPKLHFLRTSHPRQRISHAMCFLQLLPNHSDEFVQDLHLFPFYPAHTSPYIPCKAALYDRHQRSSL